MEKRIKAQIKAEITQRLVGKEIKYANLRKVLHRIHEWWDPGFKFIEPLKLAEVPVKGSRMVTVEFVFWGDLDWGEGIRAKKAISGTFGPIEILFYENDYHLNFSEATFSPFEVD